MISAGEKEPDRVPPPRRTVAAGGRDVAFRFSRIDTVLIHCSTRQDRHTVSNRERPRHSRRQMCEQQPNKSVAAPLHRHALGGDELGVLPENLDASEQVETGKPIRPRGRSGHG